jgi:hypothetical protein
VFQDFVQIDSPLQRRYRGSGLGLALSSGWPNCWAATSASKAKWAWDRAST